MKIIVVFLLLILPFILVAQEIQNPNNNRVHMGITFSPDYCYRILKSDNSNLSNMIIENRDDLESARFGYSTGISMIIKVNKKLIIESGVLFSDKGEKIDYQHLIFGDQIDPRLGFIYSTSEPLPSSISLIYRYQYLDIPMKLNYNIFDKKINIFVSFGISTNIFIAHKITSVIKYANGEVKRNSTTDSNYSFNSLNFAVLGGLGLDYDFNDNLSLRIEPIYRRSINTIIDAPINSYLYSIGLNTGVYYKLTR